MSSKTVAVPSDSTASTRDNANGFSTSGDSRVFLEDYAEAIKSLAEQQPMATAFLTTPVAPPRHKSTDPDNDPVWPQKAAARALKFALDEVADGRLVPSHYTFEHHRAASLGLGKGPEISYVFDDKRMAALFFVPVDASTGRPARDEFRGLFYPTRFCQGPMDNCHGGSSFTFTDCVATVLTGLYLSGSGADKGKLPYLSTKSHELTYKDGVPIGTISAFRSRITGISNEGSATVMNINTTIFARTDPKGLGPKFAVDAHTVIRIPFEGFAVEPVPTSLPPLEESVFAKLAARQPELKYMPRQHLSLLLPLLRGKTHQALRLPERGNRSERYFREEDPVTRRAYGIYFLGRPQGPPVAGDQGMGDLRSGGEIVGLAYFHPERAGSGSGVISHGAMGAYIDSGYGMLINTLLLSSVPKETNGGQKPTMATHQWNFRTLVLKLDFNAEARYDGPGAGVVMFRVWVKRVEGGGRKTIFGGAIYQIPTVGPATSPDRAQFIHPDLKPLVESESLFVDASKKYGGRPIGWGTGEGAVKPAASEEKKEQDSGFETGKL